MRLRILFDFLWVLLISGIWLTALGLVWISVTKTQLGYEIHRLKRQQDMLLERNLRLKCEIAALYDLDKSRHFAQQSGMKLIDPGTIEIVAKEQPK